MIVIPVGSMVRLLRWISTNPRGALRFFLMLAIIVIDIWSFFNTAFSYMSAAGSGANARIVFYVVAILDIAVLLALPFLLQLYDRLAHLPPDDPSFGCLVWLGILSIPVLALWVLIGLHPKTVADIEGTIMGVLLCIALDACVYLSWYLRRKRQRAYMIERAATAIKAMGPRPPRF